MPTVEARVPYSRVRACFEGREGADVEGVIYENGMVGVRKDWYYAGRVDRSLFGAEAG